MRWTLSVVTLFISLQSSAQMPKISALEEYLYTLEYRSQLLDSKGPPKEIDQTAECLNRFKNAKEIWERESKIKKLILQGEMEKSFSRDDIEKMGTRPIHQLLGKVRGTDKYLTKDSSYAYAPLFPHEYRACQTFFTEETSVVSHAGKKCRQIRFSYPELTEVIYYQLYCENSSKLFINFDRENRFNIADIYPSSDCPHCK